MNDMDQRAGQPQLDLGKPVGKLAKASRPPGRGLLLVVVVLQIALLVFLFVKPAAIATNRTAPDGDTLRAVALDLEDRGLYTEAADQWGSYLGAIPPGQEEASVLYRMGDLLFKARLFDKAAAAWIRAERSPGCDDALKQKIGPRMVDCLRQIGLVGEVRRELARRTTAVGNTDSSSPVLATLAGESFTDADLDRLIGFRVDRMLALQGAADDAAMRQALLDRMSDPKVRQQIFSEIMRTELLSRRARELYLGNGEEFKNALALAEQEILAAMLLEQELGKVSSTPVDVEAYFNAHVEDYKDGSSGEIPDFETVADRVASDYVTRKRTELGEALLKDLMARYDVKVVAQPESKPAAPSGEKETDTEDGAH